MKQIPQMLDCRICPRDCGVDRYRAIGFCGAGAYTQVNLWDLHHGEEPPISGTRGSGTVFFSHCNLKCVFCQNYSISCQGFGREVSIAELTTLMLVLQDRGAHNINLVTPTHYTPQIIEALQDARRQGLEIPVLWNSSAYEKVETLAALEPLVDIYLPDWKYFHGLYARRYSHAENYPQVAQAAIREMLRQKGYLQCNEEGIATQGVLLRLLVLPRGISGTEDILREVAEDFGTELPLSLMAQYYPAGEASKYPELSRGITAAEYDKVVTTALELGFTRVYQQELSCSDEWTPDFIREDF